MSIWTKALASLPAYKDICADIRDTRIVLMLFVSNQKVKLRVLFDLNTQLIKSLDWCVACEEILRTRTKGNDLQVTNTDNGTCNWYEVCDHFCNVVSSSYRIFRNISLKMTHL